MLALALPASAMAEPPTYDGGMGFGTIHSPADPEDYAWLVDLGNEGELRQIDESAEQAAAAKATAEGPGAPQPSPRAPAPHVLVTNALGSGKLVYRPHSILLSGDGTFWVSRIRWKSYGGAVARATARGNVNDCVPYCAAGHLAHPAAKLTLRKIVECHGRPVYARLRYKLSGPLPNGFPRRGGYSMLPLDEDGKPDC